MNETQPTQEELDSGGFIIQHESSRGMKEQMPFVSTGSAIQPETPGGQSQDIFVVPPHEHDDRDSNRIRERFILQRSERVYVRLPGTSGATAANYGNCFIALAPCFVRAVKEVHGTAGTDAGAVTLDLEKLTGATSPGAGATMLITTFNMKGAVNTLQTGVFDPDRTKRTLSAGDRMALKLSGTPTAVADVVIIIEVEYLT